MAFRTLRRITTPAKNTILGLTGEGHPMILERQSLPRRLMATPAATREHSPDEFGSDIEKRESSMPFTRGLRGFGRRRLLGRWPSHPFFDIWDPLHSNRSLKQMLDTVDRLFDAPFVKAPASPAVSSNLRTPWDMREDDDAFRLRIDMPGLSKEEVKVMVEDGELVIKGEHKAEEKSDDSWSSRSYGSYNTRMNLSDCVKLDEVKAELKNGVLHVVLPKTTADPKKNAIDIEVN